MLPESGSLVKRKGNYDFLLFSVPSFRKAPPLPSLPFEPTTLQILPCPWTANCVSSFPSFTGGQVGIEIQALRKERVLGIHPHDVYVCVCVTYFFAQFIFLEGGPFCNLHKGTICTTLVALFPQLFVSPDTMASCSVFRFILMELNALKTEDVINSSL